jgi:hypothetical protein
MSTGSLMNMYNTITFIVVFAFFSFILFVRAPRFNFFNMNTNSTYQMNCGPFLSNNVLSPTEEVGFFPTAESISNRIILSLLVQFSIFLVLYMIGYSSSSQIEILHNIKNAKFKEYDLKIVELQEKLNKLDLKEKYLRQ